MRGQRAANCLKPRTDLQANLYQRQSAVVEVGSLRGSERGRLRRDGSAHPFASDALPQSVGGRRTARPVPRASRHRDTASQGRRSDTQVGHCKQHRDVRLRTGAGVCGDCDAHGGLLRWIRVVNWLKSHRVLVVQKVHRCPEADVPLARPRRRVRPCSEPFPGSCAESDRQNA